MAGDLPGPGFGGFVSNGDLSGGVDVFPVVCFRGGTVVATSLPVFGLGWLAGCSAFAGGPNELPVKPLAVVFGGLAVVPV